MKFVGDCLHLYAITDRKCLHGRDLKIQVELAIKGGATMIQLREKNISTEKLAGIAAELVPICHKYNVPLIVNDDWKAAVISGADGVHVGLDDESVEEIRKNTADNFIIGATVKTIEQARKAELQGADYIGAGAVFSSPTKTDAVRITTDELRKICRSVKIPAVAIGGITKENLWKLRGCGNRGIAVVSAVFGEDDTYSAANELSELWSRVYNTRTSLTIAGSDTSGGAGIQADIRTMQAHKVYAMSAITALTAQNTKGVNGIKNISAEFVARQIDAVFDDMRPDAVKIGMVPTAKTAEAIADRLKHHGAENIVVDPVMSATSGGSLGSIQSYELIFPMAFLATPNIPEAEIITGMKISCREDIEKAAAIIHEKYGCNVLIKGGHSIDNADDFLLAGNEKKWFVGARKYGCNVHGTGCTFSSAIASNLALGYPLHASVGMAKQFMNDCLESTIHSGRLIDYSSVSERNYLRKREFL